MTTITELQEAILGLSKTEYTELRRWLREQDWERWERELDDVRAGKLNDLAADLWMPRLRAT